MAKKRKWTDEQLIDAVNTSKNYSQVLENGRENLFLCNWIIKMVIVAIMKSII
jgi:hypothetical protein